MICLNCKQQIPDDSDRCPNCGTEVFHKDQLVKEIGIRRWQRWIFYSLFILAFLGAIGIILKIYDLNTKLLIAYTDAQGSLSQKQDALAKAQTNLDALQKTENALEDQNRTVSGNLAAQIITAQQAVADAKTAQNQVAQNKTQLDFFNSLLQAAAKSAVSATPFDLSRIPFGDIAYGGIDTDGDGLPDNLEAALGTSATSSDTDGDKYSDRAELISGFDPLIAGASLPIDPKFAAAQKGKIFIDQLGYLWYVGTDAKRYFLGKTE